jgi:integrase/recombinase XerD
VTGLTTLPELDPIDYQILEMWVHGKSSATAAAYQRYAGKFLMWVRKPLAKVTLADLQNFAMELAAGDLEASSQKTILNTVKSLLSYGHRIGSLPFNVGAALITPHAKDTLTERLLSEADVANMIRLEPNFRCRMVLTLLYATGMRVSELCQLHWKDFMQRDDEVQVTIYGKGGKTRRVLINNAKVCRDLATLRGSTAPERPVFVSRKTAGQLQRGQVLRLVKAAALRAALDELAAEDDMAWERMAGEIRVGKKLLAHTPVRKLSSTQVLDVFREVQIQTALAKVSPHWLRHAHGSHAMDRQAPIHLVQATLGHANVATTSRYLHAKPSDSSCRFLPL